MSATQDVRCFACSKWSPKRCSEGMARQGFGACDHHEPFICYAGNKLRDCPDFAAAPEDVVTARREFLERLK